MVAKTPNQNRYKGTNENESDVAISLDQSLAYVENKSMIDELGLDEAKYRKD